MMNAESWAAFKDIIRGTLSRAAVAESLYAKCFAAELYRLMESHHKRYGCPNREPCQPFVPFYLVDHPAALHNHVGEVDPDVVRVINHHSSTWL